MKPDKQVQEDIKKSEGYILITFHKDGNTKRLCDGKLNLLSAINLLQITLIENIATVKANERLQEVIDFKLTELQKQTEN